jgi:hypothetical protein
VAVLAIGMLAGTALAATGPNISEVSGSFLAHAVRDDHTECQGVNGHYLQDTLTLRGTQTSTDPRLSGNIKITANLLVNGDTGIGLFFGRLEVRNPTSGETTAVSNFAGASRGSSRGSENKGIQFVNFAHGLALLNLSVLADRHGHIRGTFGTDPAVVAQDLAVTFEGQPCTSGFLAGAPMELLG